MKNRVDKGKHGGDKGHQAYREFWGGKIAVRMHRAPINGWVLDKVIAKTNSKQAYFFLANHG